MFYAILGIIVVVALFLIFRDDHDKSYNKKEKEPRKAPKTEFKSEPKVDPKTEFKSEPKVEQPKAEKKASGASLKDQILGEIEAAIR
ncbi:MAG: hypothetical protein IK052_00975, partial [Bacteroidales bacterium]|nr:hypothetical protein [Bacteroidales bacterium]